MRKTEGITKYELQWQLIRSSIKGSGTKLEDKLLEVNHYFSETKTYDRWERVYNWLEGLERGYKAAGNIQAISRIADEKSAYTHMKDTLVVFKESYLLNEANSLKRLTVTSDKALKVLWKDLFKTNEGWLKKGYFHKECNAFMDWLRDNSAFMDRIDVGERHSLKHLEELRSLCSETENTHNFFF